MRAGLTFLLLLLLLTSSGPDIAAGQPQAAAPVDSCAAPADLTIAETPLPALQEAIRGGGPVEVLAVGSGTMLSPETGSVNASFPYRMVEALQKALPQVTFRLTVKGGRGVSAAEMLDVMHDEFAKTPFRLVLWQTGTVEAVRGLRPEDLYDTLAAGAELTQAHNADLVLIDPQFSRFLRANANLDPYEAVLQRAASLPGVMLFHRYELMRTWVSQGTIDLERTPKAEQARTAELLHRCLGQALAAQVLKGAEQASN
jgi:hypothetical protein